MSPVLNKEDLDDLIAERDAAIEHARLRTVERDRARCTAVMYGELAWRAYQLLWQAVEMRTSHADEADLGRRIAAFLRESAADAGPDRLPLPAGWEDSDGE